MYSLATGLGIIVTMIVVFGFNGLIYYNSSLEVLATYDITIMVYALLATLVPARIARLEARTLQVST
jgi:hypothetical protein